MDVVNHINRQYLSSGWIKEDLELLCQEIQQFKSLAGKLFAN